MRNGTVPLLNVRDMARSLRFYVDALGFEMTRSWAPDGAVRWALLARGPLQLMLQEAKQPAGEPGAGVELFFVVDEVDALHEAITAQGVRASAPETAFYGMRQMELRDPDGYRLCFECAVEGG